MHWHDQGEAGLSDDQRNAIREANFETYNLVTIFANSQEIAQILRIVTMDEDELEGLLASRSLPSRYVYYIVGPVSSGKSTTLRHLRDLATVEEWPAQMPVEMNRQSIGLTRTLSQRIDQRLEHAIWTKNSEIRNIKVGIVAVDRAPLDFVAFPTKTKETMGVTTRKRAKTVLGRLAENDLRDVCSGQVIVLHANPLALACRQLKRGNRAAPKDVASGSTERYLSRQQDLLRGVYKRAIKAGGLIETERHSLSRSLKATARIIHLDSYSPFDFATRLRSLRNGR